MLKAKKNYSGKIKKRMFKNKDFPMTWDIRLRIVTEVVGALFYLYSAAS